MKSIRDRLHPTDAVCVLCGKGNNAGDGYELARILRKSGYNVACISVFAAPPKTETALKCYQAYQAEKGSIENDPKKAKRMLEMADVIVDAVFGIGFEGVIERDSTLFSLLDTANLARAYRIALDIPSGVHGEDGSVGGIAFIADKTLTVTAFKLGMFSYPGRAFCGEVEVMDIGIPQTLLDSFGQNGFVPDDTYVSLVLPKRGIMSNKGDFGKLLCVCGSEYMTGAACLSVQAALRSGAGLVTLAACPDVIQTVRSRFFEPIYRPLDFRTPLPIIESLPNYSAVLFGCGIGRSADKRAFLEALIRNAESRLIIDADGINLLSEHIDVLKEARKIPILTPHPGEFSRLTGLSTEKINEHRIKYAVEFSREYRCVTVLKGAGTITAAPDGRYAVNPSGNAGLAKGGSGDVLAGLIAGLAANSNIDTFEAAVCGVYLHGRAADVLKMGYSEYGLLPSDLAGEVAKLLP